MSKILSPRQTDQAAHIIRNGGLVVFPTETVYGLGGNALLDSTATKIYEAKGRPSDNPLIVHISSLDQIHQTAASCDEISLALAESFWPGPLTIILPRHDRIPARVTGGLDSIALRLPDDPLALELISKSGVPIAAPSANRSGRPSPTSFWMAQQEMEGRVDAIIQGEDTRIGLESTIVWVSERGLQILRPGSIGPLQIRKALDHRGYREVPILLAGNTEDAPTSPGSKYPHYSPKAAVETYTKIAELKDIEDNAAILTIHAYRSLPKEAKEARIIVYGNLDDYARQLYRDLVSLDEDGISHIYLYLPDPATQKKDPIALALADRIKRASGLSPKT